MICLQCTDDVYALLPDKIACVPTSFGLTTGPAKGGNLHPNLRIFCPEGHAYLPLTPGGSCVACTNPDCARCFREDLSKCLGCKTQTFLRKGPNDSCVSTPCTATQYLTPADGNKCVDFALPGCNKMDQYGWCSKVDGEGCASGQTYAAGVCCTQTVLDRNLSTYPATCIKCHDSCLTCSGTTANQCSSCPAFHGLRLNEGTCQACTSPTCLKCDADPNICEASYTPPSCGVDKCLAGQCSGNGYQCNSGGCEQGYYRGGDGLCYICNGRCASCTNSMAINCPSCKPNFVLAGAAPNKCNCDPPFVVHTDALPNKCIPCPINCSSCSTQSVCSSCKSNFKLVVPNCICQISNGFKETSSTACVACAKGCTECSTDINTCSGSTCRSGYIDFPNCTCPTTQGYREEISQVKGEPNTCVACTAGVDCHECAVDRSVCSGCRANYTLTANGCSCITSGFRLNTTTSPHTCEPCDLPDCQNQFVLRFELVLTKKSDLSKFSDAVFEILLVNTDQRKPASMSHLGIESPELLRLSPPGIIKSYSFKEQEGLRFLALVNLQGVKESEEVEITFTPDEYKFNKFFRIEGGPQTVKIKFSGSVSPEDVTRNEDLGNTVSGLNTYGAAALETASLALGFFSFDPSGSLMKLSQMIKIYCRFRFFDINFGAYLGAYFDFSSKKFDPPTSKSLDEIARLTNKYYGNLFWKKVALDIFEVNLVRVIVYGASWFFKILAYLVMQTMKRNKIVIVALAHFITFSQKIHMVALNAIAMDLIPYSLIAILHTKNYPEFTTWISWGMLVLLLVDFCEIWEKGGKSTISEFDEGSITEKSSIIDLKTNHKVLIQKDLKHDEAKVKSRELDHEATLIKLKQNLTIQSFCTNDLQEQKQYSGDQALLMSNFMFLLKMSAMQLVFVGMALTPVPGLITLLLVEVVYLINTILPYLRHRHIKSFILLIPKVSQSCILLVIETLLLIFYFKLNHKEYSLTKSQQKNLSTLIFVSNVVEYLFLALNIFFLVKMALQERKRKKSSYRYAEHVESKRSVFVYKQLPQEDPQKVNLQQDPFSDSLLIQNQNESFAQGVCGDSSPQHLVPNDLPAEKKTNADKSSKVKSKIKRKGIDLELEHNQNFEQNPYRGLDLKQSELFSSESQDQRDHLGYGDKLHSSSHQQIDACDDPKKVSAFLSRPLKLKKNIVEYQEESQKASRIRGSTNETGVIVTPIRRREMKFY